jgi:hypothetical protein
MSVSTAPFFGNINHIKIVFSCMKLRLLILILCGIGFVLVGGCTNTASTPPAITPTMEKPTTPTVQVPATLVQSTIPVSDTDTLCGELVYCGYAPAGFETQPVTSSRCDQLDTSRMQNDQKVLQCLKNPPGAGEIKSDGDSGSGRSGNEESGWDRSLQQTYDSGYIVSGGINAEVSPGHGSEDMWVVKLNPLGTIQWQQVLGGSDHEESFSIRQTMDGGYILTGITDSDNTGDVGPNHGGSDIWVVKLYQSGGIQWQKVLGGNAFESGRSIYPTTDGGYILTGITDSDNTGDVGPNHGGSDIWVVKLNPAGDIQWQKVLGGDGIESGRSIQQTAGGEYILTGITDSDNTGDVGPNHGGFDIWVVKLNPAGTILWQQVLGGSDREESFSIRQTTDGGFILTGMTDSDNTGDVGPNHGGSDIWVVKLNPAGDIQWQKVLGGNGVESGRSIYPTTDGGYILTGMTDSDNTGDVGPNHGGSDIWVVKLYQAGDIQWQKVLGGNSVESGRSIQQTAGGEYILTGITDSDNTGDVGPNHGGSAIWLVKLNPVGTIEWQQVLGENG